MHTRLPPTASLSNRHLISIGLLTATILGCENPIEPEHIATVSIPALSEATGPSEEWVIDYRIRNLLDVPFTTDFCSVSIERLTSTGWQWFNGVSCTTHGIVDVQAAGVFDHQLWLQSPTPYGDIVDPEHDRFRLAIPVWVDARRHRVNNAELRSVYSPPFSLTDIH